MASWPGEIPSWRALEVELPPLPMVHDADLAAPLAALMSRLPPEAHEA